MMGTSQVQRINTETDKLTTHNYSSLLSSVILYLLVEKLAGPVGPDHDGLDHRYGSNSGCN